MENPNNITLDRLRYFVEAAKQEHIGRASKILHISPSVVSSAIKDLEEEFQCKLFVRERQTIRLNNEGRRTLEYAKEILASINNLKNEIVSPSRYLTGHFKLGASHFLMNECLAPSILDLQKKESQITVQFTALDTGVAVAHLQANLLDAALVFRSSYAEKLDETILQKGQFQIVVRKDHPILKLPLKKRIDALNQLPSISFRSSSGANFWEKHPGLASVGITPEHTYFYDDTQTALGILKQTDCWAFLPSFITSKNKEIKQVSIAKSFEAPVNISLIISESQRARVLMEKLKPFLQKRINGGKPNVSPSSVSR